MSQSLFQSYAADLFQAFIALIAVCLLAVLFFKLSTRRNFALGASYGPVRVVQRIMLEPRRNLYLVQAGSRVFLIGTGESGGPRLIAELQPDILSGDQSGLPQPENPFQKLQRWVLPRREHEQKVRPPQGGGTKDR